LSLRAAGSETSHHAPAEHHKSEPRKQAVSSSTTTLGDLINMRKNER
jgi:hypothetical protein